jgi:hypothetical protein
MDEPRQPPTNVPIYAALFIGAAIAFACLASWLGPALIWIVIIGVGLACLGGMHYWMWGRGMQPQDDEFPT